MRGFVRAAAVVAGFAVAEARGQNCEPTWSPNFSSMQDPIGMISAIAAHDDGSGPTTYFAGSSYLGLPTAFPPHGVARLRDDRFEVLEGLEGNSALTGPSILAMVSHNDGGGEALYVGGLISHASGQIASNIARWNGASWEPVGGGFSGRVNALCEFDPDGDGPIPNRLYATGRFDFADGNLVSNIAQWDGEFWSPVGLGLSVDHPSHSGGQSLAVFDNGDGPALYVGGHFSSAGGLAALNLARWDGSTWSIDGLVLPVMPAQAVPQVHSIEPGTFQGNPCLFVGGTFTIIDQTGVTARSLVAWQDNAWFGVGLGDSFIGDIASVTQSGEQFTLVVGSLFGFPGFPAGVSVAVWKDDVFTPAPPITSTQFPSLSARVETAEAVQIGQQSMGLIGGFFDTLDGSAVSRNIAIATADELLPLSTGAGVAGSVTAISTGPDTTLVGGSFFAAGETVIERIAEWSGDEWSPLGAGLNGTVQSLVRHDSPSGLRFLAGGEFTSSGDVTFGRGVAMFDGESWSSIGNVNVGAVSALASIDGSLYAGGLFSSIDGALARRVARWDGEDWHPMASGLSGGSNQVFAIHPWGDGLVAGGFFTNSGGVPMNSVAYWDGSAWHAMGDGLNSFVRGFSVFGGRLYAAGDFTFSGATPVRYLAVWNGSSWEQPQGAAGVPAAPVDALAVFDDGEGLSLYAGGRFATIGGVSAPYLAKWNGSAWSDVGMGLNARVRALGAAGSAVYVGGDFTEAGGVPSYGIARWEGCLAACPGDVNGDLVVDFEDLNALVAAFNTADGDALFNGAADFNGDGVVDFVDLNLLVSGFNEECGG